MMEIGSVTEGMTVRLLGPEGHPLHGATGAVGRTFTAEELWKREPMTMLGDPFSWLDGQVLVSLHEPRPRDPAGRQWTPLILVAPGDLEKISR